MKKKLLIFILCFLLFRASGATDVYLGLQAYGVSGKSLGVGLAPFIALDNDPETASLARALRAVVREDLLFEGLFTLTEGGPPVWPGKVDALAWSGLGAQVVIVGEVKRQDQDIRLECKLYDVGSGKLLFAREGQAGRKALRRLSHLLSDQLTFQLSGQPGVAHTRIAFVNNRTGNKELYVMDYDGQDARRLTFQQSIVLLPKWSPDGKAIAFNSFYGQNPDAYLLDFSEGSVHALSTHQGLNTAPAWSPDGSELALTLSRGADPELYLIERSGHLVRRLTYSKGVDTSPSFSPNGQQIVFVSDRAGNPELYLMDVTGGSAQRLTYGQWVDAPAWSPRGDLIAYQRQRPGGRYDICLIEPNGRNNRCLTDGTSRNETPAWSPDSRFLAFASDRDGRRKIYIMGVDGSAVHAVADVPGGSFEPSWGP